MTKKLFKKFLKTKDAQTILDAEKILGLRLDGTLIFMFEQWLLKQKNK